MARRPVVLMLPDPGAPQGNPYLTLLVDALGVDGVEVRGFTGAAVLRGDGDLVHLHWPEASLAIRSPMQASRRVLRLLGVLLVARLRGMPVLWTVHNLRSHERPHPRLERFFWWTFPRLVSGWFSLTEAGVAQVEEALPALAPRPHWVTPHGHYRDAYPPRPPRGEARDHLGVGAEDLLLLYVGHVRAYKNVPRLVSAFADSTRATRLVVAGSCHPPQLAEEVRAAAAGVPGVELRLERVSDVDMSELLAAADLVVLPFTETFNSGSALLALSGDRPVLLPRTPVYEELQRETGAWVRLYDDELAPEDLDEALVPTAERGPALGPRFEWPAIAGATSAAYASCLDA